MSTPSPLSNDTPSNSDRETVTRSGAHWARLAGTLKHPVQFLCFWSAITLPFAHLSLLARGIESPSAVLLFLGLLALNLVALYVGHGYHQR